MSHSPEPPDVTAQAPQHALGDRYTIENELGHGGMATVYRARDPRHGRSVAVKVLNADIAASLGTERFLQEIKTVASLTHPHIVPVHDSGETGGVLYYVMPHIDGETLREKISRDKHLSPAETVRLTRTLASALDFAHRHGVVHRDIKPENVMLFEGEPLILDFGIAKAISAAGGSSLTQTGVAIGTPAYLSPEQASGESQLDGRSDQYSLACVVYEMLSGQPPFVANTAQGTIAKRFSEPPKPLPQSVNVPAAASDVLLRALSLETTDRFPTVLEFARALEAAIPAEAAETRRRSIAVLPFTNMSADAENEFFTDGISEEIINALTKIRALDVASRTSAFAFKGNKEDIGVIGRKLKVHTVLEGSVQKAGNRLRISTQLVDVATSFQLWSERYDREMEDVFAIQDDISQAIVKALKVILSEGEKKQIEKARVENVAAYDYYLRGRQYYQIHRKSLEYARQMFNRAVETDPEYARAYAGVADSCSLLYMYFDAREFNLRQADSASAKALELEPDLAEAHVARGLAVSLSKRFKEAEAEFEMAMKLDPKLFEASYWFGRALLAEGRFQEAAKMFERASALRPEDYQAPNFLAQAYNSLGMTDEGAAANKRSIRLMEERLELNPADARASNLLAATYANFGDSEKAIDYAERSLAIDPDDAMLLYNVACTYSLLGRVDDAIGCLEKAVDKGFGHKEWLDHDPDLNGLRENPRFQTIARAM